MQRDENIPLTNRKSFNFRNIKKNYPSISKTKMTHEPRYFLNNSPLGVSIVGWYTWKLNPSCVWSFHDLLCFEHRFIMSHFFWHVFFIYFPARHTANAHALILQQFFPFFPTVGFFHFSVSSSVLIINAYTLWGRHYIFHWNDYFQGEMAFFLVILALTLFFISGDILHISFVIMKSPVLSGVESRI